MPLSTAEARKPGFLEAHGWMLRSTLFGMARSIFQQPDPTGCGFVRGSAEGPCGYEHSNRILYSRRLLADQCVIRRKKLNTREKRCVGGIKALPDTHGEKEGQEVAYCSTVSPEDVLCTVVCSLPGLSSPASQDLSAAALQAVRLQVWACSVPGVTWCKPHDAISVLMDTQPSCRLFCLEGQQNQLNSSRIAATLARTRTNKKRHLR